MKRNHGVWMVISAILIIGVGFTGFTRQFVSRQDVDLVQPEAAVMAGSLIEETLTETIAQPDARAVIPGEESAATLEITPLGPLSGEVQVQADEDTGENKYELRLVDIDNQIRQYRARNQGTTANAMKVNAEYELRLWETELDVVVDTISDGLNTEESEIFMSEQKDWLRDREVRAMEASRKHEGSALESVQYTISLADQTRTQVYTYAEEYRQLLESE